MVPVFVLAPGSLLLAKSVYNPGYVNGRHQAKYMLDAQL